MKWEVAFEEMDPAELPNMGGGGEDNGGENCRACYLGSRARSITVVVR